MKSFGLSRMALALAVLAAAGGVATQAASAQPEITQHPLVTAPSPVYETTPSFGNDGVSDLVTYTQREILSNGFFDQGDIYFQRVNPDGSASGAPVPVATDLTDDKLNDTSGDYIVLTSYDSVDTATGRILLYQISTGTVTELANELIIQEARIYGGTVVWVQGGSGASEVMIYDLAWLGTGQMAEPLTGSIPPTGNVDVGDRFVTWIEQVGDLDIGLHDFTTGTRMQLTDSPNIDERHPATSGDWIVWESQDHGALSKRIEAINLATVDYRIIADDGSRASRPSIDGDFIAFESDIGGDFDVFLYRISTGETIQVLDGAGDQYLNDVWQSRADSGVVFVAYATSMSGSEDIFVSRIDFNQPTIEVAPRTISFGEVEVGSSASQIVTVTNTGGANLTINAVLLSAGTGPAFSIGAAPETPFVLAPGETADIGLTFSPSAAGLYAGSMNVSSDASNGTEGEVTFSGEGVLVNVPPDQQVEDILAFFDDSVAAGTLVGSGHGNSGNGRLGALRNMIEASSDYIQIGLTAEACRQLLDVWRRTDGEARPPDFVAGEAAAELAAQIAALRNSLGCS